MIYYKLLNYQPTFIFNFYCTKMKIILLSLLVALSSCQATVIEERPSPFLPNATLHKMILDPNRVELAKGLIDQIFSDGNLECQEKINFINCYMAKFRALIFSVNRSKKNVKGEGKKRDDNAEQMLERLEEVKAEIIESGEKVGELNRILQIISRISKRKINVEQDRELRRLLRKNLDPKKHAAFIKQLDNIQNSLKMSEQKIKKFEDQKEQREQESSSSEYYYKNAKMHSLDWEIERQNKKLNLIRSVNLNFLIKSQILVLQILKNQKKILRNFQIEQKNLQNAIRQKVFKYEFLPQNVSLYQKVQDSIFKCSSLTYLIGSSSNDAVITVDAENMQKFVNLIFSQDFSNLETTFNFPLTLRVLDMFTDQWQTAYGYPKEEIVTQPPCCRGSLIVYEGQILSINQNVITILLDNGNTIVSAGTVCSKFYKLNETRGKKIIMNGTPSGGVVLISTALIYDPTFRP